MQLAQEGWVDGAPDEDLKADSPLVYRLVTKFVERKTIYTKGWPTISHYQSDQYYRCLILMDANKLTQLVGQLDGKRDSWFRDRLKDIGIDEEAEAARALESGGDDGGVDGPGALEDGVDVPPPPEEIAVDFMGWQRQACVPRPGATPLRVYFDHGSGGNQQRAWLTCLLHDGCIRWRTCAGDQRRFLSYMCAWHAAGEQPEYNSKALHMAMEPCEEAVIRVMDELTSEPF